VLLLLDGLESLQDAQNVNRGRFKDKGLAELIKLLAGHNPGLVVLTTRQEVPELQGFGTVVINHELDQLSDRAGADLLVELGVHGRQRELEAAIHEVQGHALSVTNPNFRIGLKQHFSICLRPRLIASPASTFKTLKWPLVDRTKLAPRVVAAA